MRLLRASRAMRRAVGAYRRSGESVGFVPTMGSLHEGHLSLVRRARRECARVAASIFVNPLQFGPGEDLDSYPRAPERDRALLRREGVDLLFEPEATRFYPPGFATRVHVGRLDERLCGPFRPGHFEGVATVMAKLLLAVDPDRLYLGGKDFQQARIIGRMVADLDMPVRVVVCPTVREPDGLAMSSRNAYLTPEERAWAPRIYRTLEETTAAIRSGRIRSAEAASKAVARGLADGPGRLEYAELVSADDLHEVRPLRGPLVLAVAYRLGRARLIDNVGVRAPGPSERPAARNGARAGRRAS